MKDFASYLEDIGEVGVVEESLGGVVYASGLPKVKPEEVVVFESGEMGQVLSLDQESAEILLFDKANIKVGTKIARTDTYLQIEVGDFLLGQTINPLGKASMAKASVSADIKKQMREVSVEPLGVMERMTAEKSLSTGVSIVDMAVPLAKGQRELVIGDRKTGKSAFLLQSILTQAREGAICVYAAIGKSQHDIATIEDFLKKNKITGSCVVVSAPLINTPGMIYLAPYTAMTVAEYFRDQGKDVLLVLDDLTAHAKFYREITLLIRRFPGRSSYPGDIFYTHSRLLERSGVFAKASISCLPVAETVMGDLSGYIQSNLMAITDGHLFFDSELAALGRRPAVNPFLSVTRIGHQPQSQVRKEASRQLLRFLLNHRRLTDLMHFGAELNEKVRRELALGDKIIALFNQAPESSVLVSLSLIVFAGLWSGLWKDLGVEEAKQAMELVAREYTTNVKFKAEIDGMISYAKNFGELVSAIKMRGGLEKEVKTNVN